MKRNSYFPSPFGAGCAARTVAGDKVRTKKGFGAKPLWAHFATREWDERCLEYRNLSDKEVTEKIKKDTEGKVGIYLMENLVTNQKFVGVVKSAGKDRLGIWRTFKKIAYNNSDRYVYLKNDITKYGIEKFKFVILEFTSEKEAMNKRNLYIRKLNPEYNEIQPKKIKDKPRHSKLGFVSHNYETSKGYLKIGPHSEKILSIIYGSLLGDSQAERREYWTENGLLKGGTRISFQQKDSNVEYLMRFWKDVSEMGYCNIKKPKMQIKIEKTGKIRRLYRFKTWTYNSFNFIHDLWYNSDGIKIIPSNLGEFLTARALTYWIMCNGSKFGAGLKLSTNYFTYSEQEFLCSVLKTNFNLTCSIQNTGVKDQWIIYIWPNSMKRLNELVLPHFFKGMKKKLHLNL